MQSSRYDCRDNCLANIGIGPVDLPDLQVTPEHPAEWKTKKGDEEGLGRSVAMSGGEKQMIAHQRVFWCLPRPSSPENPGAPIGGGPRSSSLKVPLLIFSAQPPCASCSLLPGSPVPQLVDPTLLQCAIVTDSLGLKRGIHLSLQGPISARIISVLSDLLCP